jgi:hypothetical protein
MGRAILWICVGVMNIISSALRKSTNESKGKSSYWDGVLCGLNIALILAWVCRLCGLI